MTKKNFFRFCLLLGLGVASVTFSSCGKDDDNAVAVSGISLDKSTLALALGEEYTLTATLTPDDATDKTLSWTSSDEAKATVDANGRVTAVAAGTATITARTGDKTASCNVTVSIPVSGLSLSKDTLTLAVGELDTLQATVLPANATDPAVSWSSSDEAKATVDANGKVTAVATGAAAITATTANGKTATCQVFVWQISDDINGVVVNGVRWATRNVDAPGNFATSPQASGMFYQWNRKVGWSATDPMVNSNGGTTWDATIPTDTTWAKSNDPSPTGWRVPTAAEIDKLLDAAKVTSVWTTYNGVSGRRFTDKATGATLFFPAVGGRSLDRTLFNAGTDGRYWSSTQNNSFLAHNLRFNSSSAYRYGYNRGVGFSVRPAAE